jgi:hypothetical protein
MINELEIIGKEAVVASFEGICVDGVMKPHETCHLNRSAGRDLNLWPPEYEVAALPNLLLPSARLLYVIVRILFITTILINDFLLF